MIVADLEASLSEVDWLLAEWMCAVSNQIQGLVLFYNLHVKP
jgi:hypothetical protein